MAEIIVFVKDFMLGTKIAEIAAQQEKDILFPDGSNPNEGINVNTKIVIVDLDDNKLEPISLVNNIQHNYPAIPIIGILTHVQKKLHDTAREAGCTWVLPRSSFIKNLPLLMEKGMIETD